MGNLTLSIDDEVLRRARIRAIEEGTSVNAVVRSHLESYGASLKRQQEVTRSIIALANSIRASSGGWKWNREELYDRHQ